MHIFQNEQRWIDRTRSWYTFACSSSSNEAKRFRFEEKKMSCGLRDFCPEFNIIIIFAFILFVSKLQKNVFRNNSCWYWRFGYFLLHKITFIRAIIYIYHKDPDHNILQHIKFTASPFFRMRKFSGEKIRFYSFSRNACGRIIQVHDENKYSKKRKCWVCCWRWWLIKQYQY